MEKVTYFCDRCGFELDSRSTPHKLEITRNQSNDTEYFDLCSYCYTDLQEDNIIKGGMSLEDIKRERLKCDELSGKETTLMFLQFGQGRETIPIGLLKQIVKEED